MVIENGFNQENIYLLLAILCGFFAFYQILTAGMLKTKMKKMKKIKALIRRYFEKKGTF